MSGDKLILANGAEVEQGAIQWQDGIYGHPLDQPELVTDSRWDDEQQFVCASQIAGIRHGDNRFEMMQGQPRAQAALIHVEFC